MSLLKLDPRYDVAFPCSRCEFVARGPGALEDHMSEHDAVIPESVEAVPSVEVVGPITEQVEPAHSPRIYTCKGCGVEIVGFRQFLDHKKACPARR